MKQTYGKARSRIFLNEECTNADTHNYDNLEEPEPDEKLMKAVETQCTIMPTFTNLSDLTHI